MVCEKVGVSKCSLCLQMYCLDHRFEDQHSCLGLKAIEEHKKALEAPKMVLHDRIKAKAA